LVIYPASYQDARSAKHKNTKHRFVQKLTSRDIAAARVIGLWTEQLSIRGSICYKSKRRFSTQPCNLPSLLSNPRVKRPGRESDYSELGIRRDIFLSIRPGVVHSECLKTLSTGQLASSQSSRVAESEKSAQLHKKCPPLYGSRSFIAFWRSVAFICRYSAAQRSNCPDHAVLN